LKISEKKQNSIRILIIVNEFPPDIIAGTAMSTARLSKNLAQRGHEVRVLVTERDFSPQKETWEGVELIRLSWRGPKGTGWLIRLFYILKECRKFHPDIIQGQAVSCGFLAAIIGYLLRIPSITYAQGYDVYQAKAWQLVTEIRWGCKWATAVAAVTEDLSKRVSEISGRNDIQVLPHGIEVAVDSEFQDKLKKKRIKLQDEFVILNVGRLEYVKGQDILLRAWPAVLEQFPKAKLWLVGEGRRLARLKKQVEELQVIESVYFWGAVNPKKVAAIMSTVDLFVLPSRSEPFGIVILEAMAQGLPIVAAKVKGPQELAPLAGEVYLAPPEDPLALSNLIIKGLRDLARPSEINRKWARNFFWDKLTNRFENFYENVLKAKIYPR
jgi:glycosyltransferase involved in cell wall biosynthesis